MDKSEKMAKFEKHMEETMLCISGKDFVILTNKIMSEEPFISVIKDNPNTLITLMLFTTEILSKLIPNPFKEDENNESEATE